jgi:hypothetical protein
MHTWTPCSGALKRCRPPSRPPACLPARNPPATALLPTPPAAGCAGVMVGRACLGRPWLFSELAHMFGGRYPGPPPRLGRALAALEDHLLRLAAHEGSGASAVLKMRKMVPLYLQVGAGAGAGAKKRPHRPASQPACALSLPLGCALAAFLPGLWPSGVAASAAPCSPLPCAAQGYQSARALQGELLRAASLAQWQQALALQAHDPQERPSAASLRCVRARRGQELPAPAWQHACCLANWIKGGGPAARGLLAAGLMSAASCCWVAQSGAAEGRGRAAAAARDHSAGLAGGV